MKIVLKIICYREKIRVLDGENRMFYFDPYPKTLIFKN
jgi:hypothetical protein